MNTEENTGKKQYLPSKITLILRLFAGGYLLYTAYTLLDSFTRHTGGELVFFIVFTVLFAVIGLVLTVTSALGLYRGNYAGGALDSQTEEIRDSGESGEAAAAEEKTAEGSEDTKK